MEFNDRREGGGLHLFEPRPYYPQRGADKGPSTGVQGKLFRDPKPVDSARYPRGYTPERMREVHRMPLEISSEGKAHRQRDAAMVEQMVARSTVPAGDVHPHHYYQPGGPFGANAASDNEGFSLHVVVGSPRAKGGGIFRSPPAGTSRFGEVHIGPARGEWVGQALMHELGHSKSYSKGTPHSAFDTPRHKGQEEAYADDYAQTHWRPDPRDVRRGESNPAPAVYESEEAFTRQKSYGGKTAHRAYMAARKTPILKTERLRKAAASSKDAASQLSMRYPIEPHAKPEGPLHPMQFRRL